MIENSSKYVSGYVSGKSFKAGFVALIGQPNAGKSTLTNALLGEKVSIVSDKPQTTRTRVTGILNVPGAQIVLVDAPGALKSTSGINEFLQEEVKDDVICALFAADASLESVKDLVSHLRGSRRPWFVLITKADLLGGTRTPKFFQYLLDEQIPFTSITTLKRPKEAKEEILSRLLPLLPDSPAALYDDDIYTTQTVRQMAAEFIREAAFDNLRQEIPYGLATKIMEFKEDGPIVRIRADVLLEKENHKAIVIGAKGQTLKKIGMQARQGIEKVVGRQVFLELHVSVKENWTQNPRMLKELGYVVPE
jgi:GTP-binding protein Era